MKKYKALEKSLKNRELYLLKLVDCRKRDSTMFDVVDNTTTTKFVNRACAVHGISLPVVVVVLKFPNKNGGEEVKSCTDTIGKRRTKCNCYIYIETGRVPISAVVMGAAMSMEEDKPAMFPQRKKETLHAP